MSLTLTFFIPHATRSVRTRVFTDPAQYDVEVNAARGFKLIKPKTTKPKPKLKPNKLHHHIPVDPDQFDIDENVYRHLPNW